MRPGSRARRLLEGAVDLHVHADPSLRERHGDAWDLAARAADVGMGGILLKDHDHPTIGEASIVSTHGPGMRVYSSICCNDTIGGLNPSAVKAALELGASMVFLPTTSARHDRWLRGEEGDPVPDGDGADLTASRRGEATAEVMEILSLAAAAGVPVGTGHLSADETSAVVGAASEHGTQVVVTHAPVFTGAGHDQISGWAASGAVIELAAAFCCCGSALPERMSRSVEADARLIEAIGPESVVLSSDLGFAHCPEPVEGLAGYLAELLALGLPDSSLRRMTVDNPTRLLSASRARTNHE